MVGRGMSAYHDASDCGADNDAAGGLGAGIQVGAHVQVLADDHADVVEDGGQAGLGEGQGIDEDEEAQDELACARGACTPVSALLGLGVSWPVGSHTHPRWHGWPCAACLQTGRRSVLQSCLASLGMPRTRWQWWHNMTMPITQQNKRKFGLRNELLRRHGCLMAPKLPSSL